MVQIRFKNKLTVYEAVLGLLNIENRDLLHFANVDLKANEAFEFIKFGGVYHSDSLANAANNFKTAVNVGYDELKNEHIAVWENVWKNSDVVIEGDDEAQLALRYSIYHLCSIAPHNTDKCGIPARGLSGQVYKGAAFWDTVLSIYRQCCCA